MPLSSSPALLGGVVGGVIATSVLAALYPAMRAARLAPARALRDE
jgi:ABC-type lipoprotein release transport system permease subunit